MIEKGRTGCEMERWAMHKATRNNQAKNPVPAASHRWPWVKPGGDVSRKHRICSASKKASGYLTKKAARLSATFGSKTFRPCLATGLALSYLDMVYFPLIVKLYISLHTCKCGKLSRQKCCVWFLRKAFWAGFGRGKKRPQPEKVAAVIFIMVAMQGIEPRTPRI